MQAAVIAMQTMPGNERAISLAEALHARAIAEALPDAGIDACLICRTDSPLAVLPVSVPRLCIKPRSLSGFFRLWQWQRKHVCLLLLAVGQASLATGSRLARMGKKGSRKLFAAFFLEPPDKCQRRHLETTACCICGSSFIRQGIGKIRFKTMPEIVDAAPGIDLAEYEYPPRSWQNGSRFVFGMGGSLEPNSGALLLVRAMSALWQQEDLPPWEVRMFGAGPRYSEILDEAEKLGVNPRLAILNEQPLGEVSRHCHVWIAPGSEPGETPDILWAGFAAGLPVIASKSGLHEERLWKKDAAVKIQADNPQKMAKIMLKMMRDDRWRQKMAEAGTAMRYQISLQGMAQRVCSIIAGHMPETAGAADRA